MELKKIREELAEYNDVEIFNKDMYKSQGGKEYNYYWRYPNLNLSLEYSGLQRYFLLTEEKDYLTADHYFKKHRDVTVFKHNRYSFPYHHSHDFFEMLFVWSGSVVHRVGEQDHTMKKGQICIVPPGVRHSLPVFDDSIVINVLFKNNVQGTFLRELIGANNEVSKFLEDVLYDKRKGDYGYILADTFEDEEFENLILEMFHENSKNAKLSNAMLGAFLLLVFAKLVQKYEDSIEYINAGVSDSGKGAVDDILMYIHEHLSDVTLDDIADKFHFNKYYVSRLIKSQTELTFTQLIKMIRLVEVKRLLVSTSLSLAKIGETVGYCDTSNLSKAFKKEYGVTPNQYRSKMANDKTVMS